ncbi:MAG TPA: ATP-binding protein [Anaeromyxobacteraceae bacterium]|nr:ATP-binding protein [Anaeromyxobacteraceae bacterium]
MTLRARLGLAFALFAAVPLAAALWPVLGALSQSLDSEQAARLDTAVHAVEGELRRLAGTAGESVRDLARSAEAEAVSRDRAAGALAPADVAGRAGEWMRARGLDVLALAEPDGRVLSSGHLPGRAGDVDADLAELFARSPAGQAVPRVVARAGPSGVEPVLALVAWDDVRGAEPPLRVAGGVALGPELADRLASLTDSAIGLRAADGTPLADASPAVDPSTALRVWRRVRLVLGAGPAGTATRTLDLPPEAPVARILVGTVSDGLARAELTVLLAFLATLAGATAAAAAAGAALARRVTRPVEALRAAAARVAAGDLEARVDAPATGEVAELVEAFNGMTADLARSRARLAAAERVAAWREVARRLAHEIKNPLTPIAMSIETLRDPAAQARQDFPAILGEATQAIGEEVRRLKRILDEFSRFARLPAPELAPVPPDELVQAVLALFQAPGVELVREVEPRLPLVRADRDQMLQVLLNLVRNAVDAMPSGGTLRVGARRDDGEVAFTVSDTGPGIPPGDLHRVFEPYFTTKEGGTGLGLAIAQRIVEEHGGRIEVESAPGRGARFSVRLPAT